MALAAGSVLTRCARKSTVVVGLVGGRQVTVDLGHLRRPSLGSWRFPPPQSGYMPPPKYFSSPHNHSSQQTNFGYSSCCICAGGGTGGRLVVQRLYKACHVAKLGANRGHLSYAHVVDTRFINWGTCSSSVGGSGESTDSSVPDSIKGCEHGHN